MRSTRNPNTRPISVQISPDSIVVSNGEVSIDLLPHLKGFRVDCDETGTHLSLVAQADVDGLVLADVVAIANPRGAISREEVEQWFEADGFVSTPVEVVMRHLQERGLVM